MIRRFFDWLAGLILSIDPFVKRDMKQGYKKSLADLTQHVIATKDEIRETRHRQAQMEQSLNQRATRLAADEARVRVKETELDHETSCMARMIVHATEILYERGVIGDELIRTSRIAVDRGRNFFRFHVSDPEMTSYPASHSYRTHEEVVLRLAIEVMLGPETPVEVMLAHVQRDLGLAIAKKFAARSLLVPPISTKRGS